MADFIVASARLVLAIVAVGLIRVLQGPARADRMMAAQLLGTGGIAVLLLLADAMQLTALVNVGLVLALLAWRLSNAGPRLGACRELGEQAGIRNPSHFQT